MLYLDQTVHRILLSFEHFDILSNVLVYAEKYIQFYLDV